MQTSYDIVSNLWRLGGGDPSALNFLTLSGDEPQLPSTFRVAAIAQASIAVAGLAAAELWRLRSGARQTVSVDMRHAIIECRSERYLRVDKKSPPPAWDDIAGVYRTGDGRFVRLHTNFAHHRDAVCRVLSCMPTREAVQAQLMQWSGKDFEQTATDIGGVVALMRSHDEWLSHPQSEALAELPVVSIERIGDAPPRTFTQGKRPLDGIRVLDLSRVIAGPVAGRTLAVHGADVILVASPNLPAIPWLAIDTGRGKLSTFIDLKTKQGCDTLRRLIAEADVFSQGYRPTSLAMLGFSPENLATISPGIICVSLSAYGHAGPWAEKRGFDSLVQTTTGFNDAEGQAAGIDGPKELPAQMLDHTTGYLMAFGAMMARARQALEGGSWHVRVSLAQTSRWVWSLGRIDGGLATSDLTLQDAQPFMQIMSSGYGMLSAVRHAAILSETPAHWARPAMPLGTHPPHWPTEA